MNYQEKLNLSYAPSPYQEAIFEHIVDGRGHAVVEAVAGSGKTTTIVSAARLIESTGLFVAFNKAIATELGSRLEGTSMAAKTVHSIGFSAIRSANKDAKIRVEAGKYRGLLRTWIDEWKKSGKTYLGRVLSRETVDALEDEGFPFSQVLRLFDLCRLQLVDFEAESYRTRLWDLVSHHAVQVEEGLEDVVEDTVRRLAAIGRDIVTEIDFTDMVWLPAVHQYKPRTYSWVFVDEAQDISRAQLAIIKRCVKRGGRMLFVGDRRQAIYGFAGADAQSFARVIEDTKAKVLPLSVCYRCPTKVLDEARRYCPQIEAAPDASEGIVSTIERKDFGSNVREGDMALCRVNAPLVRACFELIAEGVAATVRGRDIGTGLAKIVEKIDKECPSWEHFPEKMREYEDNEIAVVYRRGGDEDLLEQRANAIRDHVECIRIVYSRTNPDSAVALNREIASLFSDERSSVMLSSIHKAKGLEAKRVFVLEPQKLREPYAKREWMLAQEHNLAYVAYTRAQEELVFVENGVSS